MSQMIFYSKLTVVIHQSFISTGANQNRNLIKTPTRKHFIRLFGQKRIRVVSLHNRGVEKSLMQLRIDDSIQSSVRI